MTKPAALSVACLSGFAIMVLEMVGMRLLARDFGSSFYVWTSQIGVVLVALTAGYLAGGHWADRFPGPRVPALLLGPAGLFTVLIPEFAGPVMHALVDRHPADLEIPVLWRKLDPALGAALIFLPPCFVLATLPPFLIRLGARDVEQVGRTSGAVVGAGSAGSIAGVFLSGYLLMDLFTLPQIFRGTGILILGLSAFCAWSLRATPSTTSS